MVGFGGLPIMSPRAGPNQVEKETVKKKKRFRRPKSLPKPKREGPKRGIY